MIMIDNTNFILAVVLIVAFIACLVGTLIHSNYKLRKLIRSKWGKTPLFHWADSEESLKEAWEYVRDFHKYDGQVDDITWADLDMRAVFERLNLTYSSVGSEALYQRLRNFYFCDEERKKLEEQIEFYQKNPRIREKLQYRFAQLGKKDANQAKEYLALGEKMKLGGFPLQVILGIFPIVGIIIAIFGYGAGLILAFVAFTTNTVYYMIKKKRIERQLISLSYVVRTISAGKGISKIKTPGQQELKAHLAPLKKLLLFSVPFRYKEGTEIIDAIIDYVNIIFMIPFIAYNYVLKELTKQKESAMLLWDALGRLEVAYAVLNFRMVTAQTCLPQFKKGGIVAKGCYHPLIEEPVKNPIHWEGNTIVTGSNASGKSTYVKSVAINCILAQTINTALADAFTMEPGHVLTSMAVRDDLLSGDSYFIVEIKSLKRILDQLEKGQRCYCFIDEILRGTNTIERIAASASVIRWMTRFDSLLLVATHDIELPEILKEECENIHFEEQVREEEVFFDYQLKQGVATTKNALLLLATMDYPPELVTEAKKKAAHFEEVGSWVKEPDGYSS